MAKSFVTEGYRKITLSNGRVYAVAAGTKLVIGPKDDLFNHIISRATYKAYYAPDEAPETPEPQEVKDNGLE